MTYFGKDSKDFRNNDDRVQIRAVDQKQWRRAKELSRKLRYTQGDLFNEMVKLWIQVNSIAERQ